MTTSDLTTRAGRRQAGRRRKLFGGYPRVSDLGDRTKDTLRSPELQRELVDYSAAAEGVDVRWYDADLDVSGSKSSRTNLDAILAAIERGELDGIYVARLNRLSRLPARERIELVDRVSAAGGEIRSAQEPNDVSTPEGRFVRELFYNLARMEWERYADGFTHAKQNAMRKGVAIVSVAPFGYAFDGEHRLVVDEDARPVVVELFERRARNDEGSSYGALSDWLLERIGRRVPRNTIRRYLTNRVYLGELCHGGELSPIRHEAIVAVDVWDRVQAAGAKRRIGRGVAVGRATELLTGILSCGGCGGPLFKHRERNGAAYVCQSRDCSAKGRANVAELDAHVTAAVIEWAGPAADAIVELELELGARGDRVLAEDRLAKAQAVAIAYEQNVELELRIGEDAYAAGRQARADAVERAQADLDACGAASELVEVVRATLREALTGDELDVAERRRLFTIAIGSIVVSRPARHGAPVVERASIRFADEAPAASSGEQDRAELVAELA